MHCSSCGSPNADDSKFCARCGGALAAAAVAVAAPAPAVSGDLLGQKQQVAPYWHTLLMILILVGLSITGARRVQRAETAHTPRPLLYATTIAMQWTMLGFVWLGVRRRGYKLRDLTGKPWKSVEDALLDVAIAAGFWIGAVVVLAVTARLIRFAPKLEDARKALDFIAPSNALELGIWVLLALTAGICEEIIFRGYLQRQFAALSRSVVAGILISAALFGASHAYEGGQRMILIGLLGAMLGALAVWRKNLRPSMIAHTWQDVFAGFGLFVLRRLRG
ncbi:MAG TPA: CPBP family intramembrane glutamic endopeptidase [Terriglobales bacterium]|nr:CPBP family intramembrane glutamic endopeptidase [Terriglobales bacterium]